MEEFKGCKWSRKRLLCVHLQRTHKLGVLWFSFTPEEKASCAETSQEHFIHYQIMSLPPIRPLPETSRSCVRRTKRRSRDGSNEKDSTVGREARRECAPHLQRSLLMNHQRRETSQSCGRQTQLPVFCSAGRSEASHCSLCVSSADIIIFQPR